MLLMAHLFKCSSLVQRKKNHLSVKVEQNGILRYSSGYTATENHGFFIAHIALSKHDGVLHINMKWKQ